MPYQLIDTVTPDVGAKAGADKINNNAIQAQYQGGYFSVGGTANAITLTSATGAPSGYATGQEFCCRLTSTNTGPVTVNVDGLGIKTAKTITGADLPAGYLSTTSDTCFRYDGVNLIANTSIGTLADQVPANSNLSAAVCGTASFSSDVYTFTTVGTGFRTLQAGMYLSFKLPSSSANTTTTPDIDYNDSTYTIKWIDGSALEADDLDETYNKQPILFYFDGTDMLIASDISGSNSDGEWLKKADGSLLQRLSGVLDQSAITTNAFGTTAGTTYYARGTFTFPKAFSDTSYTGDMSGTSTSTSDGTYDSKATSSVRLTLSSVTNGSTDNPFDAFFIGRWY